MINLINKIKNRKGFTLVELLVVLAVLAIISAIAIPKFAGVQASAKKKADLESIELINKAIELYIAAEGKNPVAIYLKTDNGGTSVDASDESIINTLVKEGYLKTAPKCAEHNGKYFIIDSNLKATHTGH